jgi:hypothetical protein
MAVAAYCCHFANSQRLSIGPGLNLLGNSLFVGRVDESIYFGNYINDDLDVSMHVLLEPLNQKTIRFRYGLDYYRNYHAFWAGSNQEPFGIIRKNASVVESTFFIPVQAGFHFGPLELYGGTAMSYSFQSRPQRMDFADTPEINELYYEIQRIVKPLKFHYLGTMAFQISKRIELQGQYIQTFGSITKNLIYQEEEYLTTTKSARISFAILYHIEPQKIVGSTKKRKD